MGKENGKMDCVEAANFQEGGSLTINHPIQLKLWNIFDDRIMQLKVLSKIFLGLLACCCPPIGNYMVAEEIGAVGCWTS